MTGDPHFVVWCQQCDWNLNPKPLPEPKGRIARYLRTRSDAAARDLFENIAAHPETKRRGRGVAVTVAIFAGLVHLLTAALLVGALLLVVLPIGASLAVRIPIAVLMLMFGYYVQPFRRRRQSGAPNLTRSDAPRLFDLIDQVSNFVGGKGIGGKGVDKVIITTDFNAGARRGTVVIGLSLWAVLEPQERVSVVAHEVGHGVNHDLRANTFVRLALASLGNWQSLLSPASRSPWQRRTHDPRAGLVNLGDAALPIILFPLSILIGLVGRTLDLLADRQGQRSEYYADELSARAAGTAASVSSLEKLLGADVVVQAVRQTVRFERDRDPWQAARDQQASIPPGEWERRRRLARADLARIDVTHPPTQLRADLLMRRPHRPPGVTVSAEQSAAIDTELQPAATALARKLRDASG